MATVAPGSEQTTAPNGLALVGGTTAGANGVRTESAAQLAANNPAGNVFKDNVKTAATNPGAAAPLAFAPCDPAFSKVTIKLFSAPPAFCRVDTLTVYQASRSRRTYWIWGVARINTH